MDIQVNWQLVMKSNVIFSALLFLPLAAPSAWAQDDVDAALASGSEASQSAAVADEAQQEELPEIGESASLQKFELGRGVYFSGDLGVFLSLGGVKGYSNVQPYMAVRAGFDLSDMISVQLSLGNGLVSGNPPSAHDDPNDPNGLGAGGNQTSNYSTLNVGPEVVFAFRPTERIAIEPKIGGGISYVTPSLTQDATQAEPVLYSSVLPMASFGVDFKYLTLLTNFTAGISISGYYIIGPNIPAVGAAFVVRYTM